MLSPAFLVQKPGEQALDLTVTDNYVGGQPLKVTTNGALGLLKSSAAVNFVGLAANDKYIDVQNGNATYVSEISEVILSPSFDPTSGDPIYPYAEAYSAYVPGDLLYINTSGLWTRTSPGTGSVALLQILKLVGDPASALWCQIKSYAPVHA